MKLVRKVTEVRHFLALLILAVGMSVFAAGAGKAAVESKSKTLNDPVISNMTWEQGDTGATNYIDLGDGPYALCNPNCPKNCDLNCDGNCNGNCNTNCPR